MTRGSWGTDALAGISVVDLSSEIAGAFCTKILTDAGATVVKVEDESGDALRRWSPIAGRDIPSDSALFRFLARSKRMLTADPRDAAALAAVHALVGDADVIVWSPGSHLTADPRLSVPAVRAMNPSAVICALTSFGLEGPWAGRAATDLTLQAWSGGVGHRGEPAGPPVCAGGRVTEWAAGLVGAAATLTALHGRDAASRGELVDVSILEAAATMCAMTYPVTFASIAGRPIREGRTTNIPGIHKARDGWCGYMLITGQQWLDFCVLVERADWLADESLALAEGRLARAGELRAHIDAWTATHTVEEVLDLAAALRVPAAPIGDGRRVLEFEQVRALGLYERDAEEGFVLPAPPYRLSPPRSPGSSAARTPPPSPTTATATATATATDRAFAGLRVADLTTYWAGTIPGRFMAMMGADVIRVESPDHLDGFRFSGTRPFDEDGWWDWSPLIEACNIGKRHLGLDLDSEQGRDVLLALVRHCDVLIENYTPRVMEKWGLGVERLLEANPNLIVVRMPAFGLDGPWRDRQGYAQTIEMMSGMATLTGFPDSAPMVPNGQVDPLGGHSALVAVILALAERRRRGHGFLVECPLIAGALQIAAEQAIEWSAHGTLVERLGNRHPQWAPQGVYRAADDQYVAISIRSDDEWTLLRRALGDPEWAGADDFATEDGRRRAHDLIDAELSAWCAARRDDDIVDSLWPIGIPVAKVVFPHEQRNAQLDVRRFFEAVRHPVTGRHLHATFPARFSSVAGDWHLRPAPTLGQHNTEILRDLLGLSPDVIEALERDGVVGTRPRS